ncbi:MAG TPA: NAD(P)H-binding protein [Acidimicrobiales bacterium]
MRVVLLGATGRVGAPILAELLARGHDVTVVVRDATALPPESAALHHRSGDAFDRQLLDAAFTGADVVVCSVALRDPAQQDRSPAALLSTVARAAADARARLVTLGGAGSLRTSSGIDLVDSPGFPEAAKKESLGFREALRQLIDAAPAGLSWAMVSPPAAIEFDSPRTGSYRSDDDQLVVTDDGGSRISAADLAVAVVDEVDRPTHHNRRFAVGY